MHLPSLGGWRGCVNGGQTDVVSTRFAWAVERVTCQVGVEGPFRTLGRLLRVGASAPHRPKRAGLR